MLPQKNQFPDNILPPESTYESREALLAATNAWAKPRGYIFLYGKSTKTPSSRIKVTVTCNRNK
jgi:hypothetical protein